MMNRSELGKLIKLARVKKGWSQREMSEVCQCTQFQVSALERGVIRYLDIFWLCDVCQSIGIDFEEVAQYINTGYWEKRERHTEQNQVNSETSAPPP